MCSRPHARRLRGARDAAAGAWGAGGGRVHGNGDRASGAVVVVRHCGHTSGLLCRMACAARVCARVWWFQRFEAEANQRLEKQGFPPSRRSLTMYGSRDSLALARPN